MDTGSKIIIDAGVGKIRLRRYDHVNQCIKKYTVSTDDGLQKNIFEESGLFVSRGEKNTVPVYITGKLSEAVRDTLNCGVMILPAAAFWSAARELIQDSEFHSLAIIDLSASGYQVIGVDRAGALKKDLLTVNPRCGAGSGINLDRVLQKLCIAHEQVDHLLNDYLGERNKKHREQVTIRADRCGVFSVSATVSDKNQGIPLESALAVTLKSEVLKVCKKVPSDFDAVYLTGGIFSWKYARDCATDHLEAAGVKHIRYDLEDSLIFKGMQALIEGVGADRFPRLGLHSPPRTEAGEYPSFKALKRDYEARFLYCRAASGPTVSVLPQAFESVPVFIGLDVGSTMAKLIVADVETLTTRYIGSYNNHGDTIETLKHIFRDLQGHGMPRLCIKQIGITGSARYQVQRALTRIYPALKGRISVLVENYAHARGSIEEARQHILDLKKQGVDEVNQELFILIDIGGEDTKISTVSLTKGDLFDNVMNVKCSAGTGSLMDTLTALFGIGDIESACKQAFQAPRAWSINATCAVFLMENVRKLQIQGCSRTEILASANWAIVENMARTLWDQLELPANAVALLHGQTMRSDPLPLAVTHRLQEFTGTPVYCLAPSDPGHRACLGLIRSMAADEITGTEACELETFIARDFKKKIIQCRGAACGDSEARCNRVALSGYGADNKKFNVALGGCSSVNERQANKKPKSKSNTYKQLWEFIDNKHPRSADPQRLVIPRSFAVSEWAYFFARVFAGLQVPVHVDNVEENDIITAQPYFNIDTCAPHIGAAGQYLRLAREPHGIILAPQIEFLPTQGVSLGRTCTLNQGGIAVAKNLAEVECPDAHFHLFTISLSDTDADEIAQQIYPQLQPVFGFYQLRPSLPEFRNIVGQALQDHFQLRREAANKATDLTETALAEGRQIAIVAGREYILNPGIYDSHVGQLLRDKNLAALPVYVLDITPDRDYKHIYWRNPHFIISLIAAAAQGKLHERLTHPRLKALFREIESAENPLPIVQVTTFRCGPDSVTSPLISEIVKKRPFLLIQSDAVIKELAHLENRVNTYVKQLSQGLHGELRRTDDAPFEIKVLDRFTSKEGLNKETDVLYLPTLGDNRCLTSIVRAAGFTCIDNYDDDRYDFVGIVKKGRKVVGDSVCAPLAAVYGDSLRAIEDFKQRRLARDASIMNKRRLLIFNNTGNGPCRQGQYCQVHKLCAHQRFGDHEKTPQNPLPGEAVFQFLITPESEGYDIGLPEWAKIRIFQGIVLNGVLHAVLLEGGTRCRDFAEYQQFTEEYRALKQACYQIQERVLKPDRMGERMAEICGAWPLTGFFVKYFAYRFHNRDLERALRRFSQKWIHGRNTLPKPLKIYVEGEAYMRAAQLEPIFQRLLSSLGFRRFVLQYSPLWSYIEYFATAKLAECNSEILEARAKLATTTHDNTKRLRSEILAKKRQRFRFQIMLAGLRRLFAKPLYRAAGIPMPDAMSKVLDTAREVIPTLRPAGELAPYVGEALTKLRRDVDLFLNVAPEGCMVASMGEALTPKIMQHTRAQSKGRIQNLFSQDGDVDEEQLVLALLKVMGPERFYRS